MHKETNYAIPLYTTVETEYLEKLHAAKFDLENITNGTINENSLRMIALSLQKAVRKHPHFADHFCKNEPAWKKERLEMVQERNDGEEASPMASTVLEEEILEAEVAWLRGNTEECLEELADCGAVILRMMEFVKRNGGLK